MEICRRNEALKKAREIIFTWLIGQEVESFMKKEELFAGSVCYALGQTNEGLYIQLMAASQYKNQNSCPCALEEVSQKGKTNNCKSDGKRQRSLQSNRLIKLIQPRTRCCAWTAKLFNFKPPFSFYYSLSCYAKEQSFKNFIDGDRDRLTKTIFAIPSSISFFLNLDQFCHHRYC